MRIAIVNSHRSIIGGVETYLRHLLPALTERGHDVAFCSEESDTTYNEKITLPEGAPSWSVAQLGAERVLDALRRWQPNVIYSHGLLSPELEAKVQALAPSVFFAHSYYGSCVTGAKTTNFPETRPCDRRFGWQCLVHYYPRRCGGLSPLTMWSDYELQAKRLSLLSGYGAIVVASSHMAREYEKYGLAARVNVVPLPVSGGIGVEQLRTDFRDDRKRHILFLSRMDILKGGGILLEALPAVMRALGTSLSVTFGGEGAARRVWETRAARLAVENPGLEITFPGWLDAERRNAILCECDLLVMPSLLPEPFGLAGLEAGLYGVPVVAFAVGGLPEWLKDGVNGALAPGNPPRAAALSTAIVRCLGDRDLYRSLCLGARAHAQRFGMQKHLTDLMTTLERVAHPERS